MLLLLASNADGGDGAVVVVRGPGEREGFLPLLPLGIDPSVVKAKTSID